MLKRIAQRRFPNAAGISAAMCWILKYSLFLIRFTMTLYRGGLRMRGIDPE